MSTYTATIRWSRREGDLFEKGQYSRAHEWAFDGGTVVPASASPHIVPSPWSDAGRSRPRGGVRRLAVQLPPAVLRRLRAAPRADHRQLCG